jgi:D-alanyl-D-alanine carboxypeptidase (penicillin-binding protein 5/6)
MTGLRFGVAVLAAALLVVPASARPRHHRAPSGARHSARRAGGPVDRVMAGDALWQSGGALEKSLPDADARVLAGRIPPFYNPADLSRPPVLAAPSAILVDADTGQTLWGKNSSVRRYPASTTKILTALLFIEHTQPGDIITCEDPKITQIEPSSLNIKPWEKFTAQDLLYGTLLRSGNDGAVLMAEHVAGTVEKFAVLMNARAQQLGATESHWVTPNGLHDPEHYTTVRDMARIASAAMQNPRFADAVSQPERKISRTIQVHDSLIITKARKYWERFPGADGVKTGFTRQAGHCFVGSATRDGRRLLAVVFDAKRSAVNDTVPLLSWGFARYPTVTVARQGALEPAVAVRGGLAGAVATVAQADLKPSYDSLKPEERSAISTEVVSADVHAPVHKGDVVGQLVARLNGRMVGSVPLLAANDVVRSPLGFFGSNGGPRAPARVGATTLRVVTTLGGLALLLVAWRWHATTTSKSARRRRRRLATARRGDHRLG